MSFNGYGFRPVKGKRISLFPPQYKKDRKTSIQILANLKVQYAHRTGKLKRKKFCEDCGRQQKPYLHAHHEDYSKPLEVVYLCTTCHTKRHPENKFRQSYLCPRCYGFSEKKYQLCFNCLRTQELEGVGYKQSFYYEKDEWL